VKFSAALRAGEARNISVNQLNRAEGAAEN
jgi:hypothetical protein